MDKTILILTDFSRSSWDALQYALQLYQDEKCDFYILNTYVKEAYGLKNLAILDPEESFNNFYENRSIEGLGDIMSRLMQEVPTSQHNFYTISRPYGLLEAVIQVQEEIAVDIIVMGAKGLSDASGEPMGTSTLEIIKNVRNCPVIVVPKSAKYKKPREIVLATDFKSRPNEAELKHLLEIARRTGAEICVLSFTDTESLQPQQKENKMVLRNRLNGVDHSFYVLHNVNLPTAIGCFVESRDSQMISIIQAKPDFWQRMGFGKSLLGRLRHPGDVPLMALHASL